MGVTVSSGSRVFEILLRDERVEYFRDVQAARIFLRALADVPGNMAVLRDMTADLFASDTLSRMTDADILDRMAHALASGTVQALTRPDTIERPAPQSVTEPVPVPEPRPAAASAAPEPAAEPEPDEPDEETLVAAEDQAAVFTQASSTASPVCTA
ncbi:MAG: hypothetical protein AB7E47_01260 [Desulfovibrionaceae bacterium]